MCLIIIGISIPKKQMKEIIITHKKLAVRKVKFFKWTYRLSGNDYRVATLSKSYLITTGITIPSLN